MKKMLKKKHFLSKRKNLILAPQLQRYETVNTFLSVPDNQSVNKRNIIAYTILNSVPLFIGSHKSTKTTECKY